MKLIKKLFITISFIFLFGITNVSASSLELSLGNFSSNGTNNTFYTYVTGGTTVDFRTYVYSYGGAFSNDEENTITNEKYAHLVINTCALNLTGERYVYGITNIQGNATLQGADVYASNTKCSFILDGTQYNGKYLYFYVPIKTNYLNLESVVWLNTFNFKVHFTNNTGVLALGATAYTEFPSFLSDGANQSVIIDQNQSIIDNTDKIDDSINSDSDDTTSKSCGIICKLKGIFTGIIELPGKLISLLIDALKSLFIPDDMSFLTDLVDSLEDKLGFIAEVPITMIEFMLDLVNMSWEEMTTITFPTIEIFGYYFWEEQVIDVTPLLERLTPYRYITNMLCVGLCVATLQKWYNRFNGGGE